MCESEYVRVPCICVLRVECSVCVREFVFVVCMINTRKHAQAELCMFCVCVYLLQALCDCVLVYSAYRYVCVILLSVFQSFFAICNTYSMMSYTLQKKR